MLTAVCPFPFAVCRFAVLPFAEFKNMKKSIASIIVTYNSMRWIDRCVGGLVRSEHPVDIFVVDNHSTDGTPEKIESDYPEVELIRSDQNLGFAAGNNIGIQEALKRGADYIFLLNHDAWVEPDTVGTLLKVAEAKPECGILSPMHLNGAGSDLDRLFSTYIEPEKCPGLLSDLYLNQTKPFYSVENVNAAAWFVRSEVFQTAGLFDPIFHMYGEDNNYIHRTQFHGFGIGVTPLARIYHDREERPPKIRDERIELRDQVTRMMVIILNPNMTLIDRQTLLFRKSMSDMVRNLRAGRIKLAFQNKIVFLRGYFRSFRYKNRHQKLESAMKKLKD